VDQRAASFQGAGKDPASDDSAPRFRIFRGAHFSCRKPAEKRNDQKAALHSFPPSKNLIFYRLANELGKLLETGWGFRTMPISVPGMPITGSGMMAIMIPG